MLSLNRRNFRVREELQQLQEKHGSSQENTPSCVWMLSGENSWVEG